MENSALLSSWVDGVHTGHIPVHDRGLAYGHGIFESMRIADGVVLNLTKHLDRLATGAAQIGMQAPDRAELIAEIQECVRAQRRGVLKLLLTAGSGGRGYGMPQAMTVRRVILLYEFVPAPKSYYDIGVNLAICNTRLASQPGLAGIKHLNRLEQVLARSEWSDEYQEGLMLDQDGFVIEGTMSNLFAVRHGTLMTASLDNCGVSGIQRQNVLELAQARDVPTRITEMTLENVQNCHELFVCNSIIGIWPVAGLVGQRFEIGPITKMLCGHINKDMES